MAGTQAKARIDQDQKDGETLKVSSTPTLFVNGIRVVGLPDDKAFSWLIDQQIAATAKK